MYYNVVYEEIHLNTICQIQEKTKVIIMTIVNKSQYKFRLVNKLVEILSSQQGLLTILWCQPGEVRETTMSPFIDTKGST